MGHAEHRSLAEHKNWGLDGQNANDTQFQRSIAEIQRPIRLETSFIIGLLQIDKKINFCQL